MQWYEAEVRELEMRRRAGLVPLGAPVFYGSSSFRLWNTLDQDVDPAIVNLAFGGSTLEACVFFFDRLVVPVQPSSLVIYAGDNDLGDGRSAEQVVTSFQALAAKVARLPGAPTFGFLSIKPSLSRWNLIDRIREANQQIRSLIAAMPNAYYVDLFPAMLGSDGQPRPELFEADGLHLSRAGYRVWAEALKPYRNRIFAAV